MARPYPVVAALLLAVTAQAQPRVDWSKAETVNVLMVDNSFEPNELSFRHGMTYRLHLESHGKDLHEFTAPEFLAGSVVGNPDVLANGGKEVVVQPGQWVDVLLMPLQIGTFKLICTDHEWDRMVGEIVVK